MKTLRIFLSEPISKVICKSITRFFALDKAVLIRQLADKAGGLEERSNAIKRKKAKFFFDYIVVNLIDKKDF